MSEPVGDAAADSVALAKAADRLDELAESAELMGDPAGSVRLRQQAADLRLRALTLNDS